MQEVNEMLMKFARDAKYCKTELEGKIKVRIRGKRALFSRPEMTVERVTYDVPTVSAMKGVLRAVYNHDGMDYNIRNIFVCRCIRTDSVIRNETKVVQDVDNPKPYLPVDEYHTQRNSVFLVEVEYIVDADIVKVPNTFSPKEHKLEDFYRMFFRRLENGGVRHQPCLGQQEFTCVVRPYLEPKVRSVYAGKTLNLGLMYQDTRIINGKKVPIYADTKLIDGRLVYSNEFIPMGVIE